MDDHEVCEIGIMLPVGMQFSIFGHSDRWCMAVVVLAVRTAAPRPFVLGHVSNCTSKKHSVRSFMRSQSPKAFRHKILANLTAVESAFSIPSYFSS
jgi:hypothetical protein